MTERDSFTGTQLTHLAMAIGQINEMETCRAVMYRLLNEYVDAVEKAGSMLPEV